HHHKISQDRIVAIRLPPPVLLLTIGVLIVIVTATPVLRLSSSLLMPNLRGGLLSSAARKGLGLIGGRQKVDQLLAAVQELVLKTRRKKVGIMGFVLLQEGRGCRAAGLL